jgi:hypothetical protein
LILFLADGQLGNQMFQYMFLKTIQKNDEMIFVSGFEDLIKFFEINDFKNLNRKNKILRGFLYRIIRPILGFLSDKKIISSVSVNHEQILEFYERETTTYTNTKGVVGFINYVRLGFFQSEKFFNKKFVEKLNIQQKYISEANRFLNSIPPNSHRVFVHLRRGDYNKFTVYGKSTLLPTDYFKEQIDWFLRNRENSFFIFLSDAQTFIENEFSYLGNKIISTGNEPGTDLAIMTKCDSAVLSPSSFGWWGAYLMKNRDTVFVPKYWLGFNSRIEFQNDCVCEFMNEVNVF